ncbi:MAG: hypothetical protein AUJ74_06705 [Candidatus Omnitrophica bacterium CG1_02_44_16]|nr:MAG: hypothetical protein AUJ74_06705 [Candidatus Omnitrophica bacterium CG1_02_44_16]PIY83848.1 MAG: hypothetical protein COY78_00695 [Candidatus Omnitrophica bacterium CG_4_10_14_0_8_um_filter_44_12]PIZ84230.1 MAG: hypothetical protein COX96_04920 [Candidatus Omnitrophica bacterium CG_4_10_14_0_2_um_filter_44_9]
MKTRKIVGLLLCLALALFTMVPVQAQVTSISGTASVEVPSFFEFSFVRVFQNLRTSTDPIGGTPSTGTSGLNLNFNPLVLNTDGTYTGTYWYAFVMIPSTSGRAYQVLQSGVTTASHFPSEAIFIKPDYQSADRFDASNATTEQGRLTSGEVLGPPASIITSGASNLVYDSGGTSTSTTPARSRIIRCYMVIGAPDAPTVGQLAETKPANWSKGSDGPTPDPAGTRQLMVGNWTPITSGTFSTNGVATASVTFSLVSKA